MFLGGDGLVTGLTIIVIPVSSTLYIIFYALSLGNSIWKFNPLDLIKRVISGYKSIIRFYRNIGIQYIIGYVT